MYFLEVLDTTKSDSEAIGVLEAKHQILYVFYCALFNFYTYKIFTILFFVYLTLFFNLIDFKKFKNLKLQEFLGYFIHN